MRFVKVYHDGSGFLLDDKGKRVAEINRISAIPSQFSHWKHNLGKAVFKKKSDCIKDAKRKALKKKR